MDTDKETADTNTKKMFVHLSKIMLRMLPIGAGPEIVDLLKDLSSSRMDLDHKILKAQKSLEETSSLIEELECGLNSRVRKIAKLRAEYEKFSRLAKVEEEKAKAIIQQIELTIGRSK